MSEDPSRREPAIMLGQFSDAWWIYAGAFRVLCTAFGCAASAPTLNSDGGCYMDVYLRDSEEWIGRFLITGGKNGGWATASAQRNGPGTVEFWQAIAIALRQLDKESTDLRRASLGPTVDEIIEMYYRSRAAGSKVTLRQLAEKHGFSYDYLRQAKVAYDKAGKWGSKPKRNSPPHTET